MLPSAKERKKNMHNFMYYYPNLCQVQNTAPLPGIRMKLQSRVLDFVGDRIKLSDWQPILKALSCDRYLHYVGIRSKLAKKNVLENVDSEEKARQVTKSPVFFTSFILTCVMQSISKCLSNSSTLSCLQLEKIPLENKLMSLLIEGLSQTSSLQHLSLKKCCIGDEGCKLLCYTLRNQCKLITLDLSGCELTEAGASFIADTIKIQKLNHYGESWKQSLRYRYVDPENMPGIRRITLNNNPRLGDEGVISILDQLIDDLWIKALDFQNCGMSSNGAKHVLELLKENKCLSIVDVRANSNIVQTMVTEIMALLAKNTADSNSEFQWLQEETQSHSTTTVSSLYQQRSNTSIYSTGGNKPTRRAGISNPSVRPSKSLPANRSCITIDSFATVHPPKRFVNSAGTKRFPAATKHELTKTKISDEEKELDKLRNQLAEEIALLKAAEEKLNELKKVQDNSDDFVYIEKSVMQEVAQVCGNFMSMTIANKLPHSRSFSAALRLYKLMSNSKLDSNVTTEKLNKVTNDVELLSKSHFDQSQKNDSTIRSMNSETQDSDSSYVIESTDSFDDHSSLEDKPNTIHSLDSKAKLIFQNLLSSRSRSSRLFPS